MNEIQAHERIAVVFSDMDALADWTRNNPKGNLYMAQKHPLGDRWYIDKLDFVTRLQFFQVLCEKDEQQMRGFVFDTVIMLDRYSQDLVQYFKLRGSDVYEIIKR